MVVVFVIIQRVVKDIYHKLLLLFALNIPYSLYVQVRIPIVS